MQPIYTPEEWAKVHQTILKVNDEVLTEVEQEREVKEMSKQVSEKTAPEVGVQVVDHQKPGRSDEKAATEVAEVRKNLDADE